MGLGDTIKGWFKKPVKKEEIKNFRSLKSQAIKELEKLKKKKQDEKYLGELNKIFRIFIMERYELKRSLTYEELLKDELLKKVKIKKDLLDVASKIHQITYKGPIKKIKNPVKNKTKKSEKINSGSLFNQVGMIIKKS